MSFEVIKVILVAIKKNRSSQLILSDEIVMTDLLKVTKLPLISERHRLIEIYSYLDDIEDILKWRYLIDIGIEKFIYHAIQYVKSHVKKENYSILENYNKEKFQSIYLPSSFQHDYRMRKDFNGSDFKKLMKFIDDNTKRI